jgi:cytochrome c biogenesis protein CcdA
MNKKNIALFGIILALALISMIPFSSAAESNYVCAVYFTGAGCPHCAKAKPVIEQVVNDTPNLVLIKYEVQQIKGNAVVFQNYAEPYGLDLGIPLILFSKGNSLSGDSPIINGFKAKVDSLKSNQSNFCPLPDGSSIPFEQLNISSLPGTPEILLCGQNITNQNNASCEPSKPELSFFKIVLLALGSSLSPCIYLVLLLILIAILTANPNKKSKVLLAGLAFALAVFLTYFVVGVLVVFFFQAIKAITTIQPILHIVFAVVVILLGLLNLRDFLSYVPGRFATEMPIMFRPKVKKLIEKVTSPRGAFVIGIFTTVFLLPCTIGLYLIAGGILSSLQFVNTLPWLGLYNLVFALPIVVVTLIIYFGLSSVENVAGWRDKNVKYIHLAAGIIMLLLGIAMLIGLV